MPKSTARKATPEATLIAELSAPITRQQAIAAIEEEADQWLDSEGGLEKVTVLTLLHVRRLRAAAEFIRQGKGAK